MTRSESDAAEQQDSRAGSDLRFPELRRLRARLERDEAALLAVLIHAARRGTRLDATHLDSTSVTALERRMAAVARRLAPGSSAVPSVGSAAREGLLRHLVALTSERTSEAAAELDLLFAFAPRALASDTRAPRDPLLLEAWQTVLSYCRELHSGRVHRLERLPFLGEAARAALATEAREIGRASPGSRYVKPGPRGAALAVDPRLMSRLTDTLGATVTPSHVANFIYYSRPGDYLVPHRDIGEFEVNVLLMVDRREPAGGARPSALLVYRADGAVERIELEPGEAVAMEARWVLHAREPLGEGESLVLLTIGCTLS